MKQSRIEEIAESYVNGNISWVKDKVKRMSKRDFVQFVETAHGQYGVDRHMVLNLIDRG